MMKKLTALTVIGIISSLSSFGQGFFNFANSSSTAVLENFSSGSLIMAPGTVRAGILWHAGAGNVVPLLGTNASTTYPLASFPLVFAAAQGTGWNLATNAASGSLLTADTRTGISAGTFNGGVVGIAGTNPNDVISLYVIGWQSIWPDPFQGFLFGWSNPFDETLGSNFSPGLSLSGAGMTSFSLIIPEPGAFSLAGLGTVTLLIFRRRK
jgi:hypothetical protein